MGKRRQAHGFYTVYRVDTDEIVMCGTVEEICERLDIVKSCVSHAVTRGSVVRRKYRIYYDEEVLEDEDF